MTQDLKQVIVYGAFGLLLGTKIVEVLFTRTDTGIMDWWLLLIGLGAAAVHYFPTRSKSAPADDSRSERADTRRNDEETLVLRDHPDTERGPVSRSDANPPAHSTDPFI
ncbi:MAG: hypothetical protein WA952_12560 [Lewinella sp.]